MKNLFDVDVRDVREDIAIFHSRHAPSTKCALRSEYRELACKKCGKFEMLAALERGLPADFAGPSNQIDAAVTDDGVLLISAASRNALMSMAGVRLRFFDLPANREYSAVYPEHVFVPPIGSRLYTPVEPAVPGEAFQVRGRQCPQCGRFRCTTFSPEWFLPPEDFVFGAARVEVGSVTERLSWMANSTVAAALKEMSGWWIRRLP